MALTLKKTKQAYKQWLAISLLHHGPGLSESKTLHSLIALASRSFFWQSMSLTVNKADQHATVERVALLTRCLSTPRCSIGCCDARKKKDADSLTTCASDPPFMCVLLCFMHLKCVCTNIINTHVSPLDLGRFLWNSSRSSSWMILYTLVLISSSCLYCRYWVTLSDTNTMLPSRLTTKRKPSKA